MIAATDLLQGNIPAEAKLSEAIARLAVSGLLVELDGGIALTPAAQKIVEGLPGKADWAERLFIARERLSDYRVGGEHDAILLGTEQLREALLVPRPKPAVDAKRPGQRQRKPRGVTLRKRSR